MRRSRDEQARFAVMSASFLIWLLFGIVGCQEARDVVETPPLPSANVPPFPVSAPELTPQNHPTGWKREKCLDCHNTRLIVGHGAWGGNQCVKCHGYNGLRPYGCGDCHGSPNPQGHPESGLHAFHVVDKGYGCSECHDRNIHRNGALDIALRRKGRYTVSSDPQDGLPSSVPPPGCTEVGCHEARSWRKDACLTCHATPPDTPSHRKHLEVFETFERPAPTCRDCHANNQHDENVSAGIIEVGGPKWQEWDKFTGQCATACHQEEKRWDCAPCHGYPPESGKHKKHATDLKIECRVCHADHQHDYRAVVAPKTYGAGVKIALLFQRGAWDRATRTCADIGCHEDRTW